MPEPNPNSRLMAFCDGVFAIALTLLVFSLKIPQTEDIHSTSELWLALTHLLPSLFAFLLSFVIIFINWVNHHATLKLIDKSSPAFIYANGFLLLAVVIIPFPTALVGEFLLTEQAAPAVVLYSIITGLQSFGWILVLRAALKPVLLSSSEKSIPALLYGLRSGYIALGVYILCAVLAFWFPLIVALLISLIWIGWIILGLYIKSE